MSTALFKSDNVYVIIRDVDIDSSNSPKELVISDEYTGFTKRKLLYGGRVILEYYRSWSIIIDGMTIQCFHFNEHTAKPYAEVSLEPEQIAAYLNQIENLGVDSFLTNYKSQVQEFKKECEAMIEEIKRDLDANYNEKKEAHLSSLRSFVMNLACMLIMLMINMNAGLDNHCYTTAYDKIINLYF